jgi:alpha-galactosidase
MNLQATGIESHDHSLSAAGDAEVLVERVIPGRQHLRLIQVNLQAQSDFHNELVHESEWLLHPAERNLRLRGNLFVVEDTATYEGWIFVKAGPLPGERAVQANADLAYVSGLGGHEIHLLAHANEAGRYPWTVLDYQGGRRGCVCAIHGFQRSLRPDHPPELLTNTWGDRSQDSRVGHEFMLQEIAAAARLGADVVQIDDGWQTGITSNSASAKPGDATWGSFASSRADFWSIHPDRFPHGLEPLVGNARELGIALGLWFAPDSTNDYALFEQDAAVILNLFRTIGIRHFKIDGVCTVSVLGEDRLRSFFEIVAKGSDNQVLFDIDITAGIRPGYFGLMSTGRLFIENRYTDWHGYWPHQTLRNFWKLTRWIDPRRLRMEFLNPARNLDKYLDDPLAPSNVPIETSFAAVMLGAPLAWLEASNLPTDAIERLARLVALWREYRIELTNGDILTLGEVPDGWTWTGLASVDPKDRHMHVLVFRECNPVPKAKLQLPTPEGLSWKIHHIAGSGIAVIRNDKTLVVEIPERGNFVWIRLERIPNQSPSRDV